MDIEDIIGFSVVGIFVFVIYLFVFAYKLDLQDKVKTGKKFIIGNSSYKCEKLNTL